MATARTTPPAYPVDILTGDVVVPPVEEPTAAKPRVFDTIKALSATRPLTHHTLREDHLPYEAFLVNRAFSLTEDTVLNAAQMNERSHMDAEMQATYYIHAVRPRRRFEAWPKLLSEPDVQIIATYYGMSPREAKLHVLLHTKEQVNAMRRVLDDGARPSRFRD